MANVLTKRDSDRPNGAEIRVTARAASDYRFTKAMPDKVAWLSVDCDDSAAYGLALTRREVQQLIAALQLVLNDIDKGA